MELNLFSFIMFSLTTLTIPSNFVHTSALNYDKEVIEADPTGNRNITEVKEPDFEEQNDNSMQVKFPTDFEEQNDNSMQVKFPTHDGIVTSDRKDTDELLEVPLSIWTPLPEVNPCKPTPCWGNFWHWCEEFNGTARCTCLETDIKSPPPCIPECTTDSECNADMACIYNRCSDPCHGACGNNAQCHVVNHESHCSCLPGLRGDPEFGCYEQKTDADDEQTLCSPSPCGPNSQCREVEDQAVCRCQKHFMGTPPKCGLECTNSSECASDKACRNHKCVVDPCVNQCAGNGNCRAIAHNGEPLPLSIPQRPEVDPCTPSPCGPNSKCQAFNGNACCTCLPNYIGSPPRCRPECTINSDCVYPYMACINNQCIDSCLGVCGNNTKCHVVHYVPYCICSDCHFGDPFTSCSHKWNERNEESSEFLEWKKKVRWNSNMPHYCTGSFLYPTFRILDCPSGSERLNHICVEIDE